MSKVFTVVIKTVAFLRSPQGKRDLLLVSAGVSGLVDIAHRLGFV